MYSSIPPQLRSSGLFCCWRYDQRKGKPTKVPYDPVSRTPAKSNDPTTFADFETACSASRSYNGLGIGIFNGVSAIDLDDCITESGKLTDTAAEIVKLMHSYTEYSPSGKGLHILFTVGNFSYDKDRYYVMNRKSGIEVYVHGATNKYLTVTGRQMGNYPYGDRTKELTQLLERFMVRPNCGENGVNGANPLKGGSSPTLHRKTPSQYNDSLGLSDDELLERAFRARNGQHFQQLWSGDTSAYGSHSEADFALCSNLAFWTQCRAEQMDRLFRQSGLMRPKWDAPRSGSTYGRITIQRSIQYCREIFTPRPNAPPEYSIPMPIAPPEYNIPFPDVPPEFDAPFPDAPPEFDAPPPLSEQESTIPPPPTAPPQVNTTPQAPKFQPFSPLQMEANQLPSFPLEALPQVIHDYIAALSVHTQTSVDMAASIALGALAVCVQGKYVVEGKAGYTEPLSLYVVVIASPGERKSAVMQEVVGPIRRYEKLMNERLEPELRENRTKRKELQRQISRLEKRLERTEDNEMELELRHCEYQLEDFPELKPVRYYADDCTPEALTSLLCANNGIFSVLSSEGGIFDILAGRYNRKPNLETWLKGHCGDEIRVDRRGREPEYIPRPTLSAVLTVQPSVLSEIMGNDTMEGRGLLARFLYCSPPSLIGKRSFLTPPIPEGTAASYELLLHQLMELPCCESPALLRLSSEAQRSFSDFFLDHERYLNQGGRAISDWAAKYTGAVLRIAGLLHLAQGNSTLEISCNTLRSAITIGRYFLNHAEFAYTQIAADLSIQQAQLVIAKLKELGKDVVRHYDLFRVCRGKFFHSAQDIDPTLELLQEHGYLRLEEAPATGRTGRKPGVQIVLNPVAFSSEEAFTPF